MGEIHSIRYVHKMLLRMIFVEMDGGKTYFYYGQFYPSLNEQEDLCNGRSEAADTSDVVGDSASVPTRKDCGLVFLGGPL
jgi:hypothetical protein